MAAAMCRFLRASTSMTPTAVQCRLEDPDHLRIEGPKSAGSQPFARTAATLPDRPRAA